MDEWKPLTPVYVSAQRKHLLWHTLGGSRVEVTKTAQVEMKGGGETAPARDGEACEAQQPRARGLHSSTSQLNLSALYGIGGARRGCVGRAKGMLWGFLGCCGCFIVS